VGYWDINGVKAHCLLDSGCEGVMISPDFIRATGIVPIKLEQLIGLQLTCVGSNSTITYGAKSTITFRNQHVEEYFNIANLDYYDVILSTPFLRRLNHYPGLYQSRYNTYENLHSTQKYSSRDQ